MNPLDLPGREFLVFYLGTAVVAVVVAAVLRWYLRQPAAEASAPPPLSSSEVAYLAGGKKLAVNAVVARLVHDKCLKLDAATGNLTLQGQLPKDAQPLERALYYRVTENPERALVKLHEAPFRETDAIQTQLEEQGLLVNAQRALVVRFWPMIVIAVVLGLGVVKLSIGIERAKPVGFLSVLLVLLGVALIGFAWRPFRSRRGDRLLHTLRAKNAALLPTIQTRPEGILGPDLSLALGLFGTGALAHESMIPLRQTMAPPSQGDWGGSVSAGGCSGGSGCGGGGGGGGCGGCGGG